MPDNIKEDLTYDKTQKEYINQVAEIMDIRKRSSQPKAFIRTYGCQQNVADSEKIKGMLESAGFDFTDTSDDADFILFNTCAVREHAEDRVFGNVGALKSLKRRYPSTVIALCGCMMEQEHVANRIYKSFPFVNLVFGTHALHRFPELFFNTLINQKRIFERGNDDKLVHEGIPVRRDGAVKGWLPIMYGCDNFCSYCIVPYVRGRERSRKSRVIINEAKQMIQDGYKEITLLGQNVNSYGKGLDEDITFSGLLKEIDKIEGDYWIRFMTSHPKDCTRQLIDTIANSKHISTHLHLPFQSGSNRVLKEMNRRYSREKYLDIINYAKEKIPNLSLTSDIIVGFPGETYDEFKETLSLVEQVEFTQLFTFIYSARNGTPAAEMNNPIQYGEKTKWFAELLKIQEKISANNCASMVGKTVRVLIESETGKNDELFGRTTGSINVELKASKECIGTFQNIKITDAKNWILKGELA